MSPLHVTTMPYNDVWAKAWNTKGGYLTNQGLPNHLELASLGHVEPYQWPTGTVLAYKMIRWWGRRNKRKRKWERVGDERPERPPEGCQGLQSSTLHREEKSKRKRGRESGRGGQWWLHRGPWRLPEEGIFLLALRLAKTRAPDLIVDPQKENKMRSKPGWSPLFWPDKGWKGRSCPLRASKAIVGLPTHSPSIGSSLSSTLPPPTCFVVSVRA